MRALLRKDAPWVVGGLVAGTIALVAALGERGGFDAFVLGSRRHEALFHTAWICGLVLGGIAGTFDELLGTREYLRQRPVSGRTLLASRLRNCGFVLLGWFVLVPGLAWLLFFVFDDGWQFTRAATLGPIAASMVPAVSACAIAVAAAALPERWWLRLLAAGCWFLATAGIAWQIATDADRFTDPVILVAAHLAMAAAFVVLAEVAARSTRDADRPWPQRVRVAAGGAMVFGVVLMSTAVVREVQDVVVRSLHRLYPVAVRDGDAVVLARADDARGWQVVTAGHVATGTVLPGADRRDHWRGPDDRPQQFEFDAPRWREAGSSSVGMGVGTFYLAANGQAWLWRWGQPIAAIGKGEARAPFGAGSTLADLADQFVVFDAASRDLWRLDLARDRFEPLPVPAGDRPERLDRAWLEPDTDGELLQQLGIERESRNVQLRFVRGRDADYVLRNGELVAVGGLRRRAWPAPAEEPTPRDVITYTVDLPGAGTAPPFHHEFTPRTGHERLTAGAAMLWSLLRPPTLQAIAHLRPAEHRPACWFDVLVSGGRRPWLVLAGCVFAALLAWRGARRLRRLGAPRATIRFWSITTLLLGPVAAVLGVVFERPRAYADRTLPGPFPAPRIVTETPIEEPVA